ncbi:ABC transporter permease [candidate division KSB1 bacterium]|nr:ABC transporter permease [candidate division KSB1 bacterium]
MDKIIKYDQLLQLLSAHAKELLREPGVLFWGILFPILMSLGLGLAFTRKQDVIRDVAVITQHQKSISEADSSSPLQTFLDTRTERLPFQSGEPAQYKLVIPNDKLGNTTFVFKQATWDNAIVMLKRGSISIIITETGDGIHYHFDPRNPEGQLNYLKLTAVISGEPRPQTSDSNIEPLTVTGTRYIDFFVPGLIAMGIMMSCMWGISYGIIEKRSQKLLRRMVATPMKKSHFLISLITVRLCMSFVESSLLFLFAWLAFGITIQGNVFALLTLFLAGNIAFAGIAIFTSYHTARTEIGNGLINVVVMPMMVLSGIFFSYHNFPDWAIPVIQKFPLTMLADGMRSIFIEGAGFTETIFPIAILSIIGVVFFSAGLKVFKWH